MKDAYTHQIKALIEGGVDILMVETIFDSLNAKAALVACQEVLDDSPNRLPIIVSAAVGRGGETMISAQKGEALWNAVAHAKPLAVGLNIDFIGAFSSYNADYYVGGDNVIFWGPMSWTIIFGLTFATFLTLIIVPTLYLLADKAMYRIAKWRGADKAVKVSEQSAGGEKALA